MIYIFWVIHTLPYYSKLIHQEDRQMVTDYNKKDKSKKSSMMCNISELFVQGVGQDEWKTYKFKATSILDSQYSL